MNDHTIQPKNGLIGLSGFAGAGKDLLFSEISKKIPATRIALADSLKLEVRDYLLKCFKIDILKATRDEKNLVRDILVAHGKVRRQQSFGQYWTGLVTEAINKEKETKLVVVPDIRYAKFEKDEHNWLSNMGGLLVHINKYHINDDNFKLFLSAPNKEEEENDPKLKLLSDYQIEWPDMETCPTKYKNFYEEKYKKELEGFFIWLKSSTKRVRP